MEGVSPDVSFLRRQLRRERAITLLSLVLLCELAWIYLVSGAGMTGGTAAAAAGGMSMGGGMAMPASPGSSSLLLVLAMWWVMMLAMMLPSAAPAILLYERVHAHALAGNKAPPPAPAMVFAAGYLLCWFAFAIVATLVERKLEARTLIDPSWMGLRDRTGIEAVLIAAGLYQLSPLKSVCLIHCRSPAAFFARHWRPGWTGAVCLGVRHGAFCVACCWALMLLLFVGGVMNLIWVAVLSVFVLIEKLLPFGPIVGRLSGAALLGTGVGVLLFGFIV